MSKRASKVATVKKRKQLPVKKAGSPAWEFIKIKRSKRNRQIVITVTLPQSRKAKKRSRRSSKTGAHFRFKKLLSNTLTFGLLAISLFGVVQLTSPLLWQEKKTDHVSQVALAKPTPAVNIEAKPLSFNRATPTRIEIPAIAVDSGLIKIGKKTDGSIEVPKSPDTAGWYEFAPTPGEIGPAIIVGHVDSPYGPAVFFNLKKLQPGQIIRIGREDNRVISFKVDKLEVFPQNDFPTQAVYGNLDYAGLRLITCTGQFNYFTKHYSHNVVVYASLTSS